MGGVVLVLAVTLVTLCIMCNGLQKKTDIAVTTNYEFEMSTNQNFVILLFDAMDGKKMNEMLKNNPEYSESLKDFTYYSNVQSSYPYTEYALPYILSGEWYEGGDFDRYIDKVYSDAQLFDALEQRNYRMGLYETDGSQTNECMLRFENMVEDEGKLDSKWKFIKLEMRLVGLKYVPYDLKHYCLMYPEEIDELREHREDLERWEFPYSNLFFYEKITGNPVKLVDENCFRFYHLDGAHTPFRYNKDVECILDGTYEMNMEACMTIIESYIKMLKEEGVYDNTVVMIMSDHGYDYNSENDIDPSDRQHSILCVKGIGEQHDKMLWSDAPIEQGDYQEAYISLLDGASSMEAFDIVEDAVRERRYLLYSIYDSKRTMTEYMQVGYVDDLDTMLPTGNTYSK